MNLNIRNSSKAVMIGVYLYEHGWYGDLSNRSIADTLQRVSEMAAPWRGHALDEVAYLMFHGWVAMDLAKNGIKFTPEALEWLSANLNGMFNNED